MRDPKALRVSEKLLFVLVLTPFLYIAVNVFVHGVPDLPSSGDAALLELSTRNVFSRWILLGPYSRFLFFHPGPMYFQIRYPVYAILGQSSSSFLVVTVLIQMLCLYFAWRSVESSEGAATASVFLVPAALYLLATDKSIWLSEWNPHIVILPFMLFVISLAAAVSGRPAWLAASVVAGSLAAQTHIAVIPSMAAVTIAAVVFALWPRLIASGARIRFRPKPLLVGLGLFVLLWSAPLYQQLFPRGGQGNMSRIVQYFQESEPQLDTGRALETWKSAMICLRGGILEAGPGMRTAAIGVRLGLLVAAFVFLRKRGDHPFLASLAVFCVLLHGISLYSVTQIRGQLTDYLVQWAGVIPLLSVFVLLGTLLVLLGRKRGVCVRLAAALFLLYSAVALPIEVRDYYRPELHPSWNAEIAVGELSGQLRENLELDDETFYVIRLVSGNQWPIMFGLLNSLEKMGLPAGVQENRFYIPTPVPDGMRPRDLLLGELTERGMSAPGLVARWNSLGVLLQ